MLQHNLNLPRTIEEIKHGNRRRALFHPNPIPSQPTNRSPDPGGSNRRLPRLQGNGPQIVPVRSERTEGLRPVSALRRNRQARSPGGNYGYSADGTPVNSYRTSGQGEETVNPLSLILLGGVPFIPRRSRPRPPKLSSYELKRSPSGVLWGLSTPGDPADPTYRLRPGPPWSPSPWRVAGAGRFVDAETGLKLDYDKTCWAIEQVRAEKIQWAFKPGHNLRDPQGDFRNPELAKRYLHKTRFASLPPQFRLMAWAKFGELWEKSQKRGQSTPADRARMFALAARIIKYRYVLGINYSKYNRLVRRSRKRIRELVIQASVAGFPIDQLGFAFHKRPTVTNLIKSLPPVGDTVSRLTGI